MMRNTTRRQITRYLSCIREAIYRDFVPHFLGCNKGRDFFLKQNTETAIELYKLKKDELAVVGDGGYAYIEKSSNNRFQIDTYSDKKKRSLIKPFLLCCLNGYIIDLYGPFTAKQNDVEIFEEILEKDKDLKKILEPKKTLMFLDRGIFLGFFYFYNNEIKN